MLFFSCPGGGGGGEENAGCDRAVVRQSHPQSTAGPHLELLSLLLKGIVNAGFPHLLEPGHVFTHQLLSAPSLLLVPGKRFGPPILQRLHQVFKIPFVFPGVRLLMVCRQHKASTSKLSALGPLLPRLPLHFPYAFPSPPPPPPRGHNALAPLSTTAPAAPAPVKKGLPSHCPVFVRVA